METNEIKKLQNLRELIASYFNTLKSTNDKSEAYTTQIKILNYYELGYVITNMLKMCILTLHHEEEKISGKDKNEVINVALILEMVLEMFPLDEFELLGEINQMIIEDFHSA
ncbi:MAG: hypothetical protein ABIP27_05010 [Flavobacterium circumlabens]|uniref:hypothetical protein n=1 Tax=Flavobacterium circumlabens TaxID=2133765 RepID=UPI003262D5D6